MNIPASSGSASSGPTAPPKATASVRVRGLRKSYGDVTAVDGVDLDIYQGEVFALLGPNGAGKTTTVEILEGYRQRFGGEVPELTVTRPSLEDIYLAMIGHTHGTQDSPSAQSPATTGVRQ